MVIHARGVLAVIVVEYEYVPPKALTLFTESLHQCYLIIDMCRENNNGMD